MSWILFTIVAMFLWTAVNILDKYIIGHELRDPILVTTIFGFAIYLLFIFVGLLNGSVFMETTFIILSMLAGIIYSVAISLYYSSMKGIEVSRIVPLLAVEPLVITIIAFFSFGEVLQPLNYAGIALIVLGAIFISHKKHGDKVSVKKFFVMAFLAVIFFSTRNVLIKYITGENDFWAMLFWFGVGGIIVPILLLILHHPHLRKKAKAGIVHLVLTAVLSGLALIFFTKAISIGSVSLVSALLATKPMLVFFVATFLSFFHPKIILEKHTPAILLKKSLAIALIVAGGIFIIM
jgi:drug/metabolite transporter (DMT)-like permease